MFREKMYNNQNSEHNNNSNNKGIGAPPTMSPRISFSNDFVESSHSHSHSHSNSNSNSYSNSNYQIRAAAAAYRDAPVSSDFEFSVSNYSMMSADELFFKGRLLPLKESCSGGHSNGSKTTTLRDELQQNDQEDDSSNNDSSFSLRPPKNPTRWRGFLGLRKSHIGSKKSDKSAADKRTTSYNHHDDAQCNNNSQEFVD